jgi:hypothetical protein
MLFISDMDLPKDVNDLSLKNNNSAIEYFVKDKLKCSPLFFKAKNLAGIIKISPKQDKLLYKDLPGSSQEDQDRIIELFTTMGSHGKVSLLMKYKKHLEKIGKEIDHVHPLKLLGIIFSKPEMKPHMRNVYNDYFKFKNFIEGFGPGMNNELLKNNLLKYIDDFAADVKVCPEYIMPYFNKKDWTGLIKYLIDN